MKKFTLLFFVLFFCFTSLQAQRKQDSLALVKIYHATGGPQWENQGNWLSDKPISQWAGVTVSQNRVTKLFLAAQLRDSLPPEIGNLTALTELSIVMNPRLGGAIPPEIGKLKALKKLYLSEDAFTGTLPPSLGSLQQLQEMVIARCPQIGGSIPDTLGALKNLKLLFLTQTNLTGPVPSALGNLVNLRYLMLKDNALSGPLPPELKHLKKLTNLNIDNNGFTGTLFPEIKEMESLQDLSLGNNQFSALQDLSGLQHLHSVDVSGNRLDFAALDSLKLNPEKVHINYNGQQVELAIRKVQNGATDTLKALYRYDSVAYQWKRDENPMDGRTESLLAVPDTAIGIYSYDATTSQWPGLVLHSSSVTVGNLHGGVSLSDSLALADLYRQTGGDNWNDNSGWLSAGVVTQWHGVSVSRGRVTGLDLEGNNLSGQLPASVGHLTGMTSLNLSSNNLSGTLPAAIDSLINLKELNLSYNAFSGNLPTGLEKLVHLENLSLRDNRFSGSLPAGLGQLSRLTKLNLTNNNFGGTLPDFSGLDSLTGMWIQGNRLSGLSDLSSLVKLQYANVSHNLLDYAGLKAANVDTGKVNFYYSPQNFRMPLTQKEANDSITFVNGYVYPQTSLQWTKDGQPLAGDTGSLLKIPVTDEGVFTCLAHNPGFPELTLQTEPVTVGKLHGGVLLKDSLALAALYQTAGGAHWTDNSNWLSPGSVSDWHGVTVKDGRAEELTLGNNNLSGKLPAEIGNLEYLSKLILWRNDLGDTLPSQIGNLKNLTGLYIDHNHFSGNLPKSLGNLVSLKDLWLQNNRFSGSIPPELGNLSGLARLYLDANQLTGNVPATLGRLKKLRILKLEHNALTGSLPSEITDLVSLTYLSINDNRITACGDLSPLTHLTGCLVFNNLLDFKALDDTHLDWSGYYFVYAPQKLVLPVERMYNNTQVYIKVDYAYHNVHYQWYKNDTALQDSTSNSITFPKSDTGRYYCKVTYDPLPNLVLVSDTTVISSPTGIHSTALQKIRLYPNPATDRFWVDIAASTNGLYIVEIFNLTGRRILHKTFNGGKRFGIDLTAYPPGVYFIRLETTQGAVVRKLVKK